MKRLLKQNGQSLVETAIAFPVILIMILAILQFTILITCQLAVNFAAYKSARAILLSSNSSRYYGFGNSNSIVKDASTTAKSTLSIFYPGTGLGWMLPASVKLYWHNGQKKSGIGKQVRILRGLGAAPNRSIWVVVKARVIIVMPFMKSIFGLFGFRTIKATCLVDTPSQP